METKNYDFLNKFKKYENDIIKHTMELIKINSVCVENEVVNGVTYRFGIGNYKALHYVSNLANDLGFKTKNIEDICLEVEYGEGKEIIAVLSHLDVVPAIGDWTNPPFEPVIRDGKIFGRGSIDDKGPAIASLYALYCLKEMGIKFDKRIRLIFGTDEETGSRGLARYLELNEMPDYGISPDADFPIIYGEKGILSLNIETHGDMIIKANGGVRYNVVAPSLTFKVLDKDLELELKQEIKNHKNMSYNNGEFTILGISAHAMEPNNGLNAIKEFANLLEGKTMNSLVRFINENLCDTRLKDMGLDIHTDEMGDLTMNMGILSMENKCTLGLNIRYPMGLDYDAFIASFKDKCNKYGLSVNVLHHSPVHYVNPNSNFIKVLHNSYIKYTGDTVTKLKTIGGGTYARDLKCGVAYGVLMPGDKEMAHEVDEFIEIDKLLKSGTIITDAIYNLGKSEL